MSFNMNVNKKLGYYFFFQTLMKMFATIKLNPILIRDSTMEGIQKETMYSVFC